MAAACDDTVNTSYLMPSGGNESQLCDKSGSQPEHCTSVGADDRRRTYCCCRIVSGTNTSMCETRSDCMDHYYEEADCSHTDGSRFEWATVLFALVVPIALYILL